VVPPNSDRISRVPPYSRTIARITRTGLSPTLARLSRRFRLSHNCHWPGPRSLATTSGVSFDILSYGYLDVSVPRVRFLPLCIQDKIPCRRLLEIRSRNKSDFAIPAIKGGFPHSDIPGSKLIRSSPRLFAAYHVLHRLCMPRHPPNALKTLDRSHCRWPSLMVIRQHFSDFKARRPEIGIKTSFTRIIQSWAVRRHEHMTAERLDLAVAHRNNAMPGQFFSSRCR
jgi:hypothetical protein